MIGYTTVGTNDVEKARHFYSELFASMGIMKLYDEAGFVAWGYSQKEPMFCLTRPFDGAPAVAGNGTMIALKAKSEDDVVRLHEKALALGGTNEGDPGMRQGGYFCAYFRDLDGNKLNVYFTPAFL